MKDSLFPIHIWVLQNQRLCLLTLCESMEEALDCAKRLPFTPKVVSKAGALPFDDQLMAEVEFGEKAPEEFWRLSPAEPDPPSS